MHLRNKHEKPQYFGVRCNAFFARFVEKMCVHFSICHFTPHLKYVIENINNWNLLLKLAEGWNWNVVWGVDLISSLLVSCVLRENKFLLIMFICIWNSKDSLKFIRLEAFAHHSKLNEFRFKPDNFLSLASKMKRSNCYKRQHKVTIKIPPQQKKTITIALSLALSLPLFVLCVYKNTSLQSNIVEFRFDFSQFFKNYASISNAPEFIWLKVRWFFFCWQHTFLALKTRRQLFYTMQPNTKWERKKTVHIEKKMGHFVQSECCFFVSQRKKNHIEWIWW